MIDEANISEEMETVISMISLITSLLLNAIFFFLFDAFLLKKISKKHLMSFLLLIICLDLSKLIFIYTMEPSRECIIIEIILIQVYLITHQAGIGPIPLILNTKLYKKFLSLGGVAVSVFTKLSNTFAFLVFPLGEEKKKKKKI